MKTIIAIIGFILITTSTFAQQSTQGSNVQGRSGRKDKPQQTPPVQNQPNRQNQGNQNRQNEQGINATGNNTNRNEDRIIGNKNDNLMRMDTSRGLSTDAPHGKTPDKQLEKTTPDPTSTNTNTPNSMAPSPSTPDASNSYNPTSNGGIGKDTAQTSDTRHYMDKLRTDIPSAQGASGNKGNSGSGTTTKPANSTTGGSYSENSTGKTRMGTTGTGFSTGGNAGENAGNTVGGKGSTNRKSTTTRQGATQKQAPKKGSDQ